MYLTILMMHSLWLLLTQLYYVGSVMPKLNCLSNTSEAFICGSNITLYSKSCELQELKLIKKAIYTLYLKSNKTTQLKPNLGYKNPHQSIQFKMDPFKQSLSLRSVKGGYIIIRLTYEIQVRKKPKKGKLNSWQKKKPRKNPLPRPRCKPKYKRNPMTTPEPELNPYLPLPKPKPKRPRKMPKRKPNSLPKPYKTKLKHESEERERNANKFDNDYEFAI